MSGAASSGTTGESKISHDDHNYLERKGVCEAIDAMLAVACQTKAQEPMQPFMTAAIELTAGHFVHRVAPTDVTREEKITKSKEWRDLQTQAFALSNSFVQQLFNMSASRTDDFSVNFALPGTDSNVDGGKNFIYFDYSKNLMSPGARQALINVASKAKLTTAMQKMRAGEKINVTEKRAAFHIGLRGSGDKDVAIDGGKKVSELVDAELKTVERISKAVRDGSWKGSSGKAITSVVHIGIGGSVLATAAATEALAPAFNGGKKINTHFISSLDGAQFQDVISKVDIETTLFVVVTKTWTTAETLAIADEAKKLVTAKFPSDKAAVAKHFVGVSAAPERASAFGVDATNVIAFWDFVGGRFSVWSGVGVTLAIACGFDNFKQFLDGAKAMDSHFFDTTTELHKNIPAMMGLMGVYNHNIMHAVAHAVVPYAARLNLFPSHLQQLEMESSGKSITQDGNTVEMRTSPIVVGGTGPEAQHSFFQLLHQGTNYVSVDLIGAAQAQQSCEAAMQSKLISNMIAQGEALMLGQTRQEIAQAASKTNERFDHKDILHRVLPGSKGCNSFLVKKMTPMALGALFAAYEHKVFVQGVVWNINSFDQFGVERGKKLATALAGQLGKDKAMVGDHDNSTNALVNLFNQNA